MESLVISPLYWKNKTVFLTGHTGFKGAWLSFILSQVLDAHVIGYALEPPSQPNLFDLLALSQSIEHHLGDIRDRSHFKQRLENSKPDIVIHMAAQPLVKYGYTHPYETYETNVLGTLNLLESLREITYQGPLLVVTSDKAYLNQNLNHPFDDSSPLGGKDPYSSSKACTDILTQSYQQSYPELCQGKIITARAGNVIGGGDWGEHRLIPDMIQSYKENKAVELRNPQATRPWQHVLEPLFAYMLLIEKLDGASNFAGAWNIGPNPSESWSVQRVAEALGGHFNVNPSWVSDSESHKEEAQCLTLNHSKLRDTLKWSPKLDTRTALKWVYDWYKTLQQGEGVQRITRQQIINYMEKLNETSLSNL